MKNVVNNISLCAGIGGLELGLRIIWPGFRTICHVEREAYPASVLVSRMEESALDEAVVADDLQSFDGRPWRGAVHCIAAGIPCQPFSVAGKRKGKADERWLGEDFLRVVDEVRPEFIVMENVPGFLTAGLDAILGGLEKIEAGWSAEWGVFRADETVEAPHRRQRFFLVAERVPNSIGNSLWEESGRRIWGRDGSEEAQPRDLGKELADSVCHGLENDKQAGTTSGATWRRSDELADSDGCRLRGEGDSEHKGRVEPTGKSLELADTDRGRFQREWFAELAGQQGEPRNKPNGHGEDGRFLWPPGPQDEDGWREYIAQGGAEPGIRRGPDGNAEGLEFAKDRLRALGNAVVPIQCAFAIATLAQRLRQNA